MHRINNEITAFKVRLVSDNGEQMGIMSISDALHLSIEKEVDLVEIAPQANPPVCRLMDYGKFKYKEAKKSQEIKYKQKVIQIKEIKFRPSTDNADYNTKLRKLICFLESGNKVKITLRFRGREMSHQDIGIRLINRLLKDLQDNGIVEQNPKFEGRQMIMILTPKKRNKNIID